MPNLRIPVRYREQGRRQQGHLVWRTLGFGDLGRMCGFLWKKIIYKSIYIYIYSYLYIHICVYVCDCVCVALRVPVCMCTATMMTVIRPWLANRMTGHRSRTLVEYFESMTKRLDPVNSPTMNCHNNNPMRLLYCAWSFDALGLLRQIAWKFRDSMDSPQNGRKIFRNFRARVIATIKPFIHECIHWSMYIS